MPTHIRRWTFIKLKEHYDKASKEQENIDKSVQNIQKAQKGSYYKAPVRKPKA